MKWNTELYDNKHDFVSKYGEGVIDLLNPQAGERILDLGCGTGDLADVIRQRGATVLGMDSSPDMIQKAIAKYPGITFDVQSATGFAYDEPFDAIFSNATLHWVLEAQQAVTSIYNNLKWGGRFVAEFGGKGNVGNIVNALRAVLQDKGFERQAQKEVWYFPSLSEYTTLLENAGFRVTFAAHFDRPTLLKDDQGMQNWLRMFGQPFFENLESEVVAEILEEVERRVEATNYLDGKWYADYVRLRVVALK
ncbi:methyltransferase domain-containing protein [Paraflavisolibacter sp. H34]|uniref:methyltransferase domain-containing protein n=1 Tax=Huijunlia imazamoxiresistens TaxID=3127457 RepID=UPI00301A0B87